MNTEQDANQATQDVTATDTAGSSPVEDQKPTEAAAETTAEVQQEAPAESTDSAEAASTPSEATAAPVSETAESSDAKLKLNPTFNAGEAAAPKPTVSESELSDATVGQSQQNVAASKGPVDIPDDNDIEADLSALSGDLDAAMSGPGGGESETQAKPDVPQLDAQAATETKDESSLEPGQKLTGSIQSVHGENILVELGYRASGLLLAKQYQGGKLPQPGDSIEVVVDKFDEAEGLIHVSLPRAARKVTGGDWSAVAVGQVVDCMVNKTNKGGLEITVGGLRGFMPKGQVGLGFIEDFEVYVGQKLTGKITEVNQQKRRLIVSAKALQIEEREAKEGEVWETLNVGDQKEGTVKTIKDYGAFVDIGGLDGLIHVGEMSWNRIQHPRDILQEGQTVTVKILQVDRDKKKISLGMKQLMSNPWDYATTRYEKGRSVEGKVTRITDFGAFVELEPGLEGLVHISELDHKRVAKVSDVLSEGQDIEIQVLEVNPNKKRISLSLKALKDKPEPVKPVEEEQVERRPRVENKNLRGGMGSGGGGGLFGNPKDYQ